MNPDAIGGAAATPGAGANGAVTDLSSAQAAEQAAAFNEIIGGIGAALLSVIVEDAIKIGNEDI